MIDYLEVLKKISAILGEERFRNLKKDKVSFVEYCELRDFQRETKGDEDTVVSPLLIKILELLGYRSGVNLLQQDFKDGDKPDFRTTETNKFILDAKSTGVDITKKTDDKSAFRQIERYLRTFKGYEYGILFNLQKFEFYQRVYYQDSIRVEHLADKTINLVKLIKDFNSDQLNFSKDFDNFKWFYETFRFQLIKPEQYVELIKNRKKEDLISPDKKYLKQLVYGLAVKIQENVKKQLSPMLRDLDYHIHLKYELDKILQEINPENEDIKYEIAAEELVKQISYVILLRFILIRIFEDNELINTNLYDGGFKRKLDPPFSFTFKEILRDARVEAGELFSYFEDKFPYNFQISRDDNLLIHVLFELSKINFAEINFDLIGDLYEHYLNEDERKDKGQFYTPHYIVEFILNRVGYITQSKGNILEKTILDPACGSGSFMVEAAIRLRNAGLNKEAEAKRSIANNIFGAELTAFASRLAELNLVIQVITLIKRIENEEERQTQSFRICTTDSLMRIFNHEEFADTGKMAFETSGFTSTYKDVFIHLMAGKNDFDFVVGNPPYVGEKGHKDLFRPLQSHPYWRNHYIGKSDYLYYFIILGLSKLRDGGKLGFITTQYWLTADGAKKLRKYILDNARIIEIIDFKGIKLFPEAKGQENIVFVLEKCSVESDRTNNRIKIIEFDSSWVNNESKYIDSQSRVLTNFDRWIGLLTNEKQFEMFADPEKSDFRFGKETRQDIAEVYYSGLIQGELDEDAWYLYSREKPVSLSGNFAFLTDMFNVNQGIVSGADKVTEGNIKKIPQHERKQFNIQPGDPIFVFDKQQLSSLQLNEQELNFIKPFYKNSDIKKGFVNRGQDFFVLYLNDIDNEIVRSNVLHYLRKFEGILNQRREVENGRIRWFDLWWPRDRSIFESEKLVTSRRSKTNTFAYENLRTYPQSDITLITPKESALENLKYLFAILNSTYIDNWYGSNTKKKGNMREYYFTPLSKVPIRKIDFDNTDETLIHQILGGNYSPTPIEDDSFVFDQITYTFIKEKGLSDYYITLKSELYHLVEAGFQFDPESEIDELTSIKINRFDIAKYFETKNLSKVKLIRDVLLFYPDVVKDPTLYTFSTSQKAEADKLLEQCSYFLKSLTKDFLIKDVNADRMNSLFADSGSLGSHYFECSFDIVTKDNKIIEVDCKTKEDSIYLVEMIKTILRKEKLVTWDKLLEIPLKSQEMDEFVSEKRKFIYEALKPMDERIKTRLREVFQKREQDTLDKIRNVHYLQYLIDLFVNELYGKPETDH